MIVETLVAYAKNSVGPDGQPLITDPAFPSSENVDYLITIDSDGRCLGIAPTGTLATKGRRSRRVPKPYRIPAVGDRASEKQAGLLCDGTTYVFGAGPWSRGEEQKHADHASTFRAVVEQALRAVPDDEGLRAVHTFYEQYAGGFESLLREHGYWTQSTRRSHEESAVLKSNNRFAFVLASDNGRPAFQRPAMQVYWRRYCDERSARKAAGKPTAVCIGCGTEQVQLAIRQPGTPFPPRHDAAAD